VFSAQWYVLSAVAGICLLCVVVGTTVCVYRCYRRRRASSSTGSLPPIVHESSLQSVPEIMGSGSPLDGHAAVKHGGGGVVGSVQHSSSQPARKTGEQHQGDVLHHGPSCTVTDGDHGVVCQVYVRHVFFQSIGRLV